MMPALFARKASDADAQSQIHGVRRSNDHPLPRRVFPGRTSWRPLFVRKKLLTPSRRSFLIGSGAGLIAAPSIAKAADYFCCFQTAVLGTLYSKSSWTDLSDFTQNGSSASVVSGAIRLAYGGAVTFNQNIQLNAPITADENVDFVATFKCIA